MPKWDLFYKDRTSWKKFDDEADAHINGLLAAARNGDTEPPDEVKFVHHYVNPYNKAKTTEYTYSLQHMTQTNPDSGKVREIKAWWSEDDSLVLSYWVEYTDWNNNHQGGGAAQAGDGLAQAGDGDGNGAVQAGDAAGDAAGGQVGVGCEATPGGQTHASQQQEFDNPVPELQALADAKHARQQIDDDDQSWGTWGDFRGKYDKTHSGGYQKNANWAPYPGTSQCKSVSWQKGPMEVGSSVEQAATKADWEFV
jgi:hypothetical protein